jgi:hypothetical protein
VRIVTFRGLCAAVSIAVLAGCATSSAPPQRAADSGGGGQLDVGLAAQAAPFEAFTRRAGDISPEFGSPGAIGAALRTGAAYEPRELEAGMIAYAAMAAMQEPSFVAGVRRAGGRDLARRLAVDPDAALALPGAQAAAARANAALHRRGAALASAGARVKKSAYSVQRQEWSKARVPNAASRLAEVKRLGASGHRASGADRSYMAAALAEGGRRGGNSPVVARSVALAAVTILGQESQARSLLSEPRSASCVRIAKLNYHQCLASAGTHYEDIYCLGVHAMAETGQCVVSATEPPRIRRASR